MIQSKLNTPQTKYELLNEAPTRKRNSIYLQTFILILLCISTSVAVYSTWTAIYRRKINIPPHSINIPEAWRERALMYADSVNFMSREKLSQNDSSKNSTISSVIKLDNEMIYPSELGNFISADVKTNSRLVCYYSTPIILNQTNELYPDRIDPKLCTHINIGMLWVEDNKIYVDDRSEQLFKQTSQLKRQNPELKVLIWVGGINSYGFSAMVKNHANRKDFIRSVKSILEKYQLDGIDIDWEFPSAHNRERQHFSQLLHEIRREYEREHRTYLLSVAVAAVEGIAFFAYDIGEINKYADFVNIMTYDYHFYSRGSPFTGLNAPLYRRSEEHSIFATLNINYTANYWHLHGLDKSKIVIGLPTYGHSFRLVNAFNTKIGAPSNGNGHAGSLGFVTYADVCWFKRNNFFVTEIYDEESCSPYLFAANEWISFENEKSIECKTNYVKDNNFGGVMIFSLNTDDYSSYCYDDSLNQVEKFPLVRKIKAILFNGDDK